MTVNTGGLLYEEKVLKVIKSQIRKLENIDMEKSITNAGFSAHDVDLRLVVFGRYLNIEIKQDATAQMGGGSFNYDMKTKKYALSGGTDIDKDVEKEIRKILNKKKTDLDKLLMYAKKHDASALGAQVTGLPLRASKKMWDELKSRRLLEPLNGRFETSIAFLHDHYAAKDCHYIQIGGAGLFYLKRNPLKLPIPQLNVPFNVELRLGRSGSTTNKTLRLEVASGNIRAQGRLAMKSVTSPYSLDKPDDLMALFGPISAADARGLR